MSAHLGEIKTKNCCNLLIGQCHEIFCGFFSLFIFPQAPDYNVRAIYPKFVRKFAKISAAEGAPNGINNTCNNASVTLKLYALLEPKPCPVLKGTVA
jgi:hypothetical protein